MSLTQSSSQEAVHYDVSKAADGRGEVCVEGNVESIMPELLLVLQHPRAEVQCHLHGPGVHVGEHLLPGQRVLVISKCLSQAFLEVNPRNLYEIWLALETGLIPFWGR